MSQVLIGTGDRAIVKFKNADGSYFDVGLPSGGTPGSVSTILAAVNTREFLAGTAVADFIHNAKHMGLKPDLIPQCHVNGVLRAADFEFELGIIATLGFRVRVYELKDGRHSNTLFRGNHQSFNEWASRTTGLEDVIMKVVKFKYNAGTTPGQERTVRVNNVSRHGSAVTIEGIDLSIPDVNDGFRKYKSSEIEGSITILN